MKETNMNETKLDNDQDAAVMPALVAAVAFGHKCCEKGDNLQTALERFHNVIIKWAEEKRNWGGGSGRIARDHMGEKLPD